jgi:PEP-CTERM motif
MIRGLAVALALTSATTAFAVPVTIEMTTTAQFTSGAGSSYATMQNLVGVPAGSSFDLKALFTVESQFVRTIAPGVAFNPITNVQFMIPGLGGIDSPSNYLTASSSFINLTIMRDSSLTGFVEFFAAKPSLINTVLGSGLLELDFLVNFGTDDFINGGFDPALVSNWSTYYAGRSSTFAAGSFNYYEGPISGVGNHFSARLSQTASFRVVPSDMSVPEPTTVSLVAMGLGLLACARRKRGSKK